MMETTGNEDKAARLCFKCLQLAQAVLGEKTVDKLRLPALYRDHVPPFPDKLVGELIIRSYLGARYPDWPPQFETLEAYMGFFEGLRKIVSESCSWPGS